MHNIVPIDNVNRFLCESRNLIKDNFIEKEK